MTTKQEIIFTVMNAISDAKIQSEYHDAACDACTFFIQNTTDIILPVAHLVRSFLDVNRWIVCEMIEWWRRGAGGNDHTNHICFYLERPLLGTWVSIPQTLSMNLYQFSFRPWLTPNIQATKLLPNDINFHDPCEGLVYVE